MPLISTSVLLGIADRGASQYKELSDAFVAMGATGTTGYFQRVSATDDSDVEIPTISGYNNVDTSLNIKTTVRSGTQLGQVVTDMEGHFSRKYGGSLLQIGGWDGYLAGKDERVSWYFAELFDAVKSARMLSANVFSEADDLFATAEIIGGPAITFTDGVNYGNGAATNLANGSNFAATQLKIVVTSMGATDADLRLSVKDKNDNPTTIDVTVPASSPGATVVNIGTASDRFLDVTNVIFVPAGSTGTTGDIFAIRNLKERAIAL